MMRCPLTSANAYGKTMNWQKISLFKLCCIAFGVLLGILVPPAWRKRVFFFSGLCFFLSYIPLMLDFFPYLFPSDDQ